MAQQPDESTHLIRCDICGRQGWHPTNRCPETVQDYHDHHTVWCTNHDDEEFTGPSPHEPYCSKLLHGIELIPEGDARRAAMWVMPTAAFTRGPFTPAEYAEREYRYGGVELCIETWTGPDSNDGEPKLRPTSDTARTLAATLISAADIEQGLTR
ncbi:hypothetical protein ORI20_03225 [Mycobacterium sp. CVI_P3]|uniref:Uncharacterized protein n=1 Tax=Mycobacterium pinniadriaticum TaxID=2994102 RepID=A0ABT3S875_9MYCO|nr:hypothetical protein [Mycobacterium pinniadriaticum]MCX2929272.1 hypothetical protein [Mycobacterium pinniadriaticum]MCX2935696.1 hypothetical protein [Mycobacterium pinniadriaticum]